MSNDLPDIYGYLAYRDWLRDWFDAKKRQNRRFSHRAFVRRTGQKSPSLLADVIQGRRNLTGQGLDDFVRALSLSGAREAFFRDLVAFDQAKTQVVRAEVLARITATSHFRKAQRLEGASLQYLTDWCYPAVHELAGCEGFRDDAAWIARTLRPSISEARARGALRVLETLGLLVRGESGCLLQAEGTLVTPHEALSVSSYLYHRGMIARSGEALEGFKARERHFLGVTVAVPEALLPELKAELSEFQERVLAMCDKASGADRVMQLNLQLFPLSIQTSKGE